MMIDRWQAFQLSILAMVFALGPLAAAQAGETFVCADGSNVTVESNQLEWMKRTNACVAGYFGLEVQSGQIARAPQGRFTVPLPERRPSLPDVALKGKTQQQAAAPRAAQSGITTGSIKRELEPGTYRRVRVLNAAPNASPWYHHTK